MTTAVATSLLLPVKDFQVLQASVLGAVPTATTYVLNCPPGTDSTECGVYNISLTLGPWASATPTPTSTGNYDMHYSIGAFEYSLHCSMTHTAAGACTVINIGGNNDGVETVTVTSGDQLYTDIGLGDFTYYPMTITAGLEKLDATATASAAATGTAAATQTTGSSSSSGTATGSTSSSSASTTSSAASARVPAGLFGLLASSLALAVVSVF